MPFGLTNAPATFQAYINQSLVRLLDHIVVVYLDNILIYLKDPQEHESHVRQVLARLRKYRLYAKLSKCSFSVPEVEFLGFLVSADGVRADPERVRSIQEWESPASFKEVQIFLGFANFYRRFVYKYSDLAAGMTNLLVGMKAGVKSGPFHWDAGAEESF